MPFISIKESPLASDAGPVEIHYRESGSGIPLVFLHGGWGYEIYPFTRQIEAFSDRFKILIPDRSGYGRSMRIEELPTDFHRRAAIETIRLLDRLQIDRPVLWGHSDGAVIATLMGLATPEKFRGLILEAFHYYKVKPASRGFFEEMVLNPEKLGERVCRTLSQEHGEDYWEKLIRMNGLAWRDISDESAHSKEDLYGGKLSELSVPAIYIHGDRDPRTEPDELAAIRKELPRTPIRLIEDAGHSPHSESAATASCNRLAEEFLREFIET
ncbi:MAG: alpha/beta hydrolase [Blastocatellia bacterium]|nr:alpha/beta hydrolase [Blastocatellia bacterium]